LPHPVHEGRFPALQIRNPSVMPSDGKAYRNGYAFFHRYRRPVDCVGTTTLAGSDPVLKAVCVLSEIVQEPGAFRHCLKMTVVRRRKRG
ncbi:MAG TPA: hypothetical protein VLT57_10090, partial [Bryobacteraceae bacterium]|nr:hypothetical protein [Bryobacteraceae bacterium]